MTITLFAITLYGQCCRRHVVGQQIVSDIVVRIIEVFIACVLNNNNANLLLRLLVAVLGTSVLLHIPSIPCPTTWRRVLDDHR